eukprot:scaffold34626_cov62-Phaeocystis_antarctica.AAC.2
MAAAREAGGSARCVSPQVGLLLGNASMQRFHSKPIAQDGLRQAHLVPDDELVAPVFAIQHAAAIEDGTRAKYTTQPLGVCGPQH